ncbi:hypothetical protein L1987_73200 [Smallanthus sonchifolius]|uniref:Uncharacterized protein n=1 Tax=Smallanthus sonchifolius TaxID=185202 RepID=A0ACB8ZZ83_9ASTR|nr:hypothetical protein L1987_73200 [Smallanthus sonchifolius]
MGTIVRYDPSDMGTIKCQTRGINIENFLLPKITRNFKDEVPPFSTALRLGFHQTPLYLTLIFKIHLGFFWVIDLDST